MSGTLHRLIGWWKSGSPCRQARCLLGIAALVLAIVLLAAPKPGLTDDPVKLGQWWGALAALVLTTLLAVTAPWWTRPPRGGETSPPMRPPTPRWFWPLVAVAMLGTAIMGSMRLNHDLWDDEEYTLRRFVQGSFRPAKDATDGRVEFREVAAGRAFHDYRKPNNHILHSLLARLSVSAWKPWRDPAHAPFSEAALRVPAYLFGIAAVATIALLLKELGLARAGVWAAFLLAAHPWHLRYASEARGYSIVLCLLPLLLVFWLRALRDGRWRWWNAVAATSFALLYTYPATLYPVGFLGVVTLLLLTVTKAAPDRVTALARWLASSTLAAAAFLVLFAPCVPQLLHYLARDRSQGGMGDWWLREFGAQLFTGMAWFKSKDLAAPQPELFAVATQHPALFQTLLLASLAMVILGAARLFSRGALPAAVTVTLVVPAALAYFAALRSGTFLYEWYLIYLLPGVIALLATGLDSTAQPFRRFAWSGAVPALLLALFLGGYLFLTSEARTWLLGRPLQPMSESVLLTRETTLPNYPGHNRVITASFNTPAFLYDPHGVQAKSMEELRALIRQSKERGVPLYLNVGNPWAASYHHPEMYKLMTESGSFEVIAHLPGFDPTLDRIVARYKPTEP
ncbi:MAG: glycosyltransferase family 39 protein [Chthoniobacterales bacterium]